MMPKKSTPFSQEIGSNADKFNFMVVGETGQGKTKAGLMVLRDALTKATDAGRTANRIKGSRHD
ncbi:Uncharacterised protein [Enterobacter cloacae]|nr:Uncharacterised protein [Enterobacter cloacae]